MKYMIFIFIFVQWLPNLNSQNMQEYLDKTRTMIEDGNYPEALQRCIWFHHNCLTYDKSMFGVRTSFALSDWYNLGEMYPPAIDSLISIRNEKSTRLSEHCDFHIFLDVMSINRTLGDNKLTIQLFENVMDSGEPLDKICWQGISRILFDEGRLDLVKYIIDDPYKEFQQSKLMHEYTLLSLDKLEKIGDDFLFALNRNFVERSLEIISYLIYLDDFETARKIQEESLALVEDERLQNIIPVYKD